MQILPHTPLEAELAQLCTQLDHEITRRCEWWTDAYYQQQLAWKRTHSIILVRAAEYPAVVAALGAYAVQQLQNVVIERIRVDDLDNLHVYYAKEK
jgi:hypothetical protein